MTKILNNMPETINARQDLIDKQMAKFEKGRDMGYIAGFYASLVKQLAADRLEDFDYIMNVLKYNSVPEKYQK